MELRTLRYFLTVVREESITGAAAVLHITQPTLSRQLAQMEQELGVRLFVRGTRKIRLTEEGRLLQRRAEELLELADKAEREITRRDEPVEGVISIGCGDMTAVQLLPPLFREFRAQYPRCSFDLYTGTAEHIQERMERGLTDIGLLLEPVSIDRYEFVRLQQKETWVVAMPPDAALAQKDAVTVQDLQGVPLILPRRLQMKNELASWFGEAYDSLDVMFTGNLISNSAVMVRAGLAYALVIEGSLRFWSRDAIVYRPLSPALHASSVVAWRRQYPYGRATEAFIRQLRRRFGPCPEREPSLAAECAAGLAKTGETPYNEGD